MSYPAIDAHRMPYDIDGTEIGTRNAGIPVTSVFNLGIDTWLNSTAKGNLNKEDRSQSWVIGSAQRLAFWWFFPELREVSGIGFLMVASHSGDNFTAETLLQGSSDTTNGMDGTWETAVITFPDIDNSTDLWRKRVAEVSFSGPVKTIRLGIHEPSNSSGYLCAVHLYGEKAATATPDDIVFCNASTGNPLVALMDWGDQPEGTTEIGSFKVKNVSSDKIANDINLQLNNADFTISWSPDGPWTTVLDIATLGIGALSNTVYVKNALEPPLLTLGPKAARVIATVGSWT